jgi:hypothetical protein
MLSYISGIPITCIASSSSHWTPLWTAFLVCAYSYRSIENGRVGKEKQLQADVTLALGMCVLGCLIFDNLLRRDERKAFHDGVVRRKQYLQKEKFGMAVRRCQVITSVALRRVHSVRTTATSRSLSVVRSVTPLTITTLHSRWSETWALFALCISCASYTVFRVRNKYCFDTYVNCAL